MATGMVLRLPPVVAINSKPFLVVPSPSFHKLGVFCKMAPLHPGVVATVASPTISATIHKGRLQFIVSSERQ